MVRSDLRPPPSLFPTILTCGRTRAIGVPDAGTCAGRTRLVPPRRPVGRRCRHVRGRPAPAAMRAADLSLGDLSGSSPVSCGAGGCAAGARDPAGLAPTAEQFGSLATAASRARQNLALRRSALRPTGENPAEAGQPDPLSCGLPASPAKPGMASLLRCAVGAAQNSSQRASPLRFGESWRRRSGAATSRLMGERSRPWRRRLLQAEPGDVERREEQ